MSQSIIEDHKQVSLDVLNKPILTFEANYEGFMFPVAEVEMLNTFESIIPKIKFVKYNEDIATLWIVGDPKLKSIKPFQFIGYLDKKMLLHLAKGTIETLMVMTGDSLSDIITDLKNPNLWDEGSTEEVVGSNPIKSSISVVTLDPDDPDRKCDCGHKDILSYDKECPKCYRIIKWESKA